MAKTPVQTEAKAPKKEIDWEAVGLHYRAGVRTLKDIGQEYGVSDAGIIKKAKKEGWERDLAKRIQQKADAKVSRLAVSELVSANQRVAETQLVEANATLQATIRREHREDIARSRRLTMKLLDELEEQTDNVGLLKDLAALMIQEGGEAQEKRNELFNKVISLSSRSGTMKTLADSLKNVIALEREAFGIDARETGQKSLEDWLTLLEDD